MVFNWRDDGKSWSHDIKTHYSRHKNIQWIGKLVKEKLDTKDSEIVILTAHGNSRKHGACVYDGLAYGIDQLLPNIASYFEKARFFIFLSCYAIASATYTRKIEAALGKLAKQRRQLAVCYCFLSNMELKSGSTSLSLHFVTATHRNEHHRNQHQFSDSSVTIFALATQPMVLDTARNLTGYVQDWGMGLTCSPCDVV
ncbi:hypothetical protein Pelo_15425 [Pelomyxa schiedti]|nr:hypothetical protein Pelo_15425 [Pelomyxa schiedti]